MTLSKCEEVRKRILSGEAYLLEENGQTSRSVSIRLHQSGFDLLSYSTRGERVCQEIAYNETLIRCSLNDIEDIYTNKPYVIQLEAGLKTIFICFSESEARNDCFTQILASVGQFLVLNQRSRKIALKKRASNPLSPVSPRPLSAWPSINHFPVSSLLNALDISQSVPCISPVRTTSSSTFSFRFPALFVALCNTGKSPKRSNAYKETQQQSKKTVVRSHTLPLTNNTASLKQYSARKSLINDTNCRSSLETRAALGILNIDSGDMKRYYART